MQINYYLDIWHFYKRVRIEFGQYTCDSNMRAIGLPGLLLTLTAVGEFRKKPKKYLKYFDNIFKKTYLLHPHLKFIPKMKIRHYIFEYQVSCTVQRD